MVDFSLKPQAESPGVSIVVCCYNSADRLPETLRHLAAQENVPNLATEVIVVDNACTDATSTVAIDIWRSLGTPYELRVVKEPVAGLSHARSRGIYESRHEILIFCDDDNWLNPSYVMIAAEIMDSNPLIGLAGGTTEAVFEVQSVPVWFEQVSGGYAVGGSAGSGVVPEGEIVWGAGMVARKSALNCLLKSGFKFLCNDRKGSMLSSGGDSELCQAIRWLGYTVYHDGRLNLMHWIPKDRLTWRYLVRLQKGFGAASIAGDAVRLFQHQHQPVRNYIRKSFIYQLVRSTMSLLPLSKQLLSLERSEGDLTILSAASKLGRWQALVALNFSYSAVVTEKARWFEISNSQRSQISNEL